jgi:hypothetical protein
VAALILDAARTSREEAERLRVESAALRLAVRRNVKRAHARTEKAAAAAAAAAAATKHRRQSASPWSSLHWQREDDSLARTLLPVD